MNIAIVLRGGVSKKQGRQLHAINPKDNIAGNLINLKPCAISFKKHILDINKDSTIDLYAHTWNSSLASEFLDLYSPKSFKSEPNHSYNFIIWLRVALSQYYRSSKSFLMLLKSISILFQRRYDLYGNDFAGISQSLAIKKGIQLAIRHENPAKPYDAIFLYRPDLFLLKNIDFSNYRLDQITCNNFRGDLGDFHFFIPRIYADEFMKLFDSPFYGNYHDVHQWIRNYVLNYMKVQYGFDDVVAGIDQEVLRKIRLSSITYKQVSPYGLSFLEWSEYDNEIN